MALRAVWKGAISFGLVHILVALHSHTSSSGNDWTAKLPGLAQAMAKLGLT